MKRRTLLKASGLAAAAITPLPLLFRRTHEGGGQLRPDSEGVLDVREGLTYRLLQRAFEPMTDGYRVPARPDGMGCFAGPRNTWVLMRNHEIDRTPALGPDSRGRLPAEAYRKRAYGGVTRVVVDADSLKVLTSNLVLTGTLRNCAGGVSPWGWFSCEETTEADHGYVFLCSDSAGSVQPPKKIPGYGRYNHEAVCIDPQTHIAYLTEDRHDGLLYRFVPKDKRQPFVGKLQALRLKDHPHAEVSQVMAELKRASVEWVDIPNPDPKRDGVRHQGQEQGAARVSRGEGIWYHQGAAFIVSTDGGRASRGQVLKLVIGRGKASDQLELVVESEGADMLDMPDNITLTPWGDVIIAEDGGGRQFVRGITPRGHMYDIARNARSLGEIAGICLSPDGSTLFLNLQTDGYTLAVRGPLRQLAATI